MYTYFELFSYVLKEGRVGYSAIAYFVYFFFPNELYIKDKLFL